MTDPERLLPDEAWNRATYETRGLGYRAYAEAVADPVAARATLFATSLTGLGGAGFPFAMKLARLLDNDGPRVVVVNAAEDEPGSSKDRVLLTRNPHVVIEGALIAAAVADAPRVVIYASTKVEAAVRNAVAELGGVRPEPPAVEVVVAPPDYVAGDAGAAVAAVNGEPARPLARPPFPTTSGVDGRPTLVANCETLANLPRILRGGAPVTRLATVTGHVASGGVFEVEPATATFADLIARAGGLTGSGVLKAVQPGGPSSALLDAGAADVLLDADAVRAAGSSAGCLAVRVLTTDDCVVELVDEIAAFFSAEQCGQCPPCRMKTLAYHRTIRRVATGDGSWDLLDKLALIDEFVVDLPRRCSLIDMPTPVAVSARQLFPADFVDHIERQRCPATEEAIAPLLETGIGS